MARANVQNTVQNPLSMHEWSELQDRDNVYDKVAATYADEIPPFDISISFRNEYGQAARMALYGVEILNEGMGLSVDDLTTEKACTFIARGIENIHPVI